MTRPLFFSYAALALGCTTFLACSDDSSEAPDASQLEPDEDGGDGGGRDAGSDGGEDLAELSASVYDPEALLEVELTSLKTIGSWSGARAARWSRRSQAAPIRASRTPRSPRAS